MLNIFEKNLKYNVFVLRPQNTIKRNKSVETLLTLNGAARPRSLSLCCIQHNEYLDFFDNLGGNYKVDKSEYELLVERQTIAEKREYFYKCVRDTRQQVRGYIQGCKAYNFLLSKYESQILQFELQLKLMQEVLFKVEIEN
ncbi:Hypothetical_protein [Hexamita inflata]|uniref:Hypothetical_protein n=1 Tax=Hexamita inflata TaxID=28002 RepID=A0AA86NEK0_9EUKA|nr:Hypothetical protein HINF_LOCUS5997 [Hexamita inflata]CAI9918355.1 Hypothetical protein HINF_LOCUS6000 [Hexamita inflata]